MINTMLLSEKSPKCTENKYYVLNSFNHVSNHGNLTLSVHILYNTLLVMKNVAFIYILPLLRNIYQTIFFYKFSEHYHSGCPTANKRYFKGEKIHQISWGVEKLCTHSSFLFSQWIFVCEEKFFKYFTPSIYNATMANFN